MRVAQICSVSLECLSKLMDENVSIEGSDTPSDPRVWLDYLAALFRTFNCLLRRLGCQNSNQWSAATERESVNRTTSEMVLSARNCLTECLRLVKEVIWPVITRVMVHYASRMRPMEHVCRLIRFIVRCFSVHLRDLLPELAEKIVLAYTNGGQHSSFLYLCSVLVDEFGEELDCRVELIIFTSEACEQTPMEVAQTLISGRQLPTPSCQPALAAQNVIVWLTYSKPTYSTSPSDMDNYCGGQRLVAALLQACCLGLMDERIHEMADILHHLKVMTNHEMFLNWLKMAVARLSVVRTDGLVQATQDQIIDFQDVVMKRGDEG
ncbi:unnamed protein product [Trichobilharzia regenti]|nr:unnamed protein product [Trichobilharzia regenti]